MLEQYNFKTELAPSESGDKVFFTAENGSGYTSGDELHIFANYHLVYRFTKEQGWYMVNPDTQIAYFLGEGASPSVVVQNIKILDQEYLNSILYVQEEQATLRKRKQ